MTEEKTSSTITREELYAQVWTTPVERLAESYGISGRGLSKICARLNVPVPPRGYWARVAAGQKTVKYKLPAATEGIPESVQIAPSPPPREPELLPAAAVTAPADQEKKARTIAIAKTLSNPHPFVQHWLEVSRRDVASHQSNSWGGWRPEPIDSTPLKKRRLLILSALFKELERLCHRIKWEDNYKHRFYAEISDQKVVFEVEERVRQVRRALSAKERADRYGSEQKWTQDKVPSGCLRFRLKDAYSLSPLKTDWIEDDQHPLEDSLSEIVGVLVAAGAILAERAKQRREEEHRRHIEQMRRLEEESRRKRDASRWRHVLDLTANWKRSLEASDLLDRLEAEARNKSGNGEVQPELAGWLSWARERARRQNPLNYDLKDIVAENEAINEWNYKA